MRSAAIRRDPFPADESSHFILDLAYGFIDTPDDLPTKSGVSKVLSAELHLAGDHTVSGGRRCAQWADGRYTYFAMQFSKPFSSSTIVADGMPLSAGVRRHREIGQ